MSLEIDPEKLALLELCHAKAHEAESDPEDSVFMTLTRRDCWIICLASLLLEESAPCLAEPAAEILERLSELLDVQKPHWRGT